MPESFKEYMNLSNSYADEIRSTFVLLSSQHSIFKNNDIIREILDDSTLTTTHNDLVNIHKDISSYIIKIAPKSLEITAERNVLILSEMIALQSSLSLINALIIAKTYSALEKLAELRITTSYV